MFGLFNTLMESLVFFISFVSGTNSFPKPLSAKEERQFIERMEQGDSDAKNKLIEHNLRLVAHIAKKYASNVRDSEDLISLGTIGLIKGINSYNSSKGTRLVTYAARCIENEILMHLRKTASQKHEISIDEPLNIDWDGNELLLSDVLGSDSDEIGKGVEQEDEKALLIHLINGLNFREKQIMEMRFGMNGYDEYTQKEVADSLGISQSYISRLEKRIIQKLKKQLEKAI